MVCCAATSGASQASVGRQRFNRERMDIALQEIIDCGVDQPVPGDRGNPSKRLGHDPYAKVAKTARRAGMAFMQMTIVLHAKLGRGKAALQSFSQALRATGCELTHIPGRSGGADVGADSTVGFTLPLSHSTCGNMKSIVAGVIP